MPQSIYKSLCALMMLLSSPGLQAQQWTEPVNVSNLPGTNTLNDFVVDSTGIIHCVWPHKVADKLWYLYYVRSEDEGQSWSSPVNITPDSEERLANPKIAAGPYGRLYVSYTYPIYKPSRVLLKKFNGFQWESADTISEQYFESYQSHLLSDSKNNLHCFWYGFSNTNPNGHFFYRKMINGTWYPIEEPYAQDYSMLINDIAIDSHDSLHFMATVYKLASGNEKRLGYFSMKDGAWSGVQILNNWDMWAGGGICVTPDDQPAIMWVEKFYGAQLFASHWRKKTEDGWTDPKLISYEKNSSEIACDYLGQLHFFDCAQTSHANNWSCIFHYQYEGSELMEEQIYLNEYGLGGMLAKRFENSLYLTFGATDTSMGNESQSSIYFSRLDITTGIPEKKPVNKLSIGPNPCSRYFYLSGNAERLSNLEVQLFDLSGKLLFTDSFKSDAKGAFSYHCDWNKSVGLQGMSGIFLLMVSDGEKRYSARVLRIPH